MSESNLRVYLYHDALPFKLAFGSIKDILTDVLLRFDHDGLYIAGIDPHKIGMVSLQVRCPTVYDYRTSVEILLGFDIGDLYKLFRGVRKDTTVAFIVNDEAPDTLVVRLVDDGKTRFHHLQSHPVDDIPTPIPFTFESTLEIPAVELHRAVRDLGNRHPSIRFQVKTPFKFLKISCGDGKDRSSVLIKTAPVADAYGKPFDVFMPTIDNEFVGKYLLKFTKTTLAKNVKIGMAHEKPLVLVYQIDDGILIRIALAPILKSSTGET
jgi:proliferating cell nuclear antigen PCNA